MMIFVWMWAASSAFFPSAERLNAMHAEVVQAQIHAVAESTRAVMTLGWADEDEVTHF